MQKQIELISVVIPVYNAEKYLLKAVESVLIQDEVGEIILVEDASPDNALQLCESLVAKNSKIKLFRHPNGENRGAGASRNLGIVNAKCDYIAFLDADDYYLPNRFEYENLYLFPDENVDGVYGALGFHYYDEEQKRVFQTLGYQEITTLKGELKPAEILPALLGMRNEGYIGHIHLDTLTVRRNVFKKVGHFNIELRLHQDSEWILRLSALCSLRAGSIQTPVGMRGVHTENRITGRNSPKNKYLTVIYWSTFHEWSKRSKLESDIIKFISMNLYISKGMMCNRLESLWYLSMYSFYNISYNNPLFGELVLKLFGNNIISKIILGLRNRIVRK